MAILVTGGAGYVGSIVAEKLLQQGHKVIILDNLRQGHREAFPPEAEFVLGDICDCEALERVFHRFDIDAVIHLIIESAWKWMRAHPDGY
jgi:UDP-glucose 4-epimerase